MMEENFTGIIKKRKRDSHKGDYGHLLILAGSQGLTGAAALCSQGALLAGSGLVTLGIPESLNPVMEAKLTETITFPLRETRKHSLSLKASPKILKLSKKCDAVVIGPGLSTDKQTQKLVRKLILSFKIPIVLDADGVNAVVNKLKILKKRRSSLVITPHPGEMARLLGMTTANVQLNREDLAKDFAKKYNLVVALKGFRTVVASADGEVYINKSGNPGMATAGSGDVLTGIIGSFLGQKINPFLASKLGVYLHGLAGDLAKDEKGETSLTASDILDKLPQAIRQTIETKSEEQNI